MKTKEFIKYNCYGCDDFDPRFGCNAYSGEECDEAFGYPDYRGKSMRERVDDYVEKMNSKKNAFKYNKSKRQTND